MTEPAATPPDRPFVAPCKVLSATAPLGWLRRGWQDYRAASTVSLKYGMVIFLLSVLVSIMAYALGSYILLLAMLSGFVLIAPLLATGLYSVSRQLGRGESPTVARTIQRMRRTLGDDMVFALVLIVIFLVWARAGSMVHVFVPAEEGNLADMVRFFAIGSAVGSIFAAFTFSVSAFSLPMVVDRDSDMITASVTSINAVLRNKPAMVVWIGSIVMLTGLGFATAGLGLIVTIPWLGYATWHGYLETVDASDWPPAEI
ncbi:MAG: DUF2189 domain-containing protein [Xanthomonadales bacterium]|nr:DUF2189 domain-containing protein [Xanthomonadales bacterium]